MARAYQDIDPPSIRLSTRTPAPASVNFNVDPWRIEESFEVWLQGTSPAARRHMPARLTATQVTLVGLATVRESMKHRRWPTEVIEGFLAAEIITGALPARKEEGGRGALARRFNPLRMFGEAGAPFAGTLRR